MDLKKETLASLKQMVSVHWPISVQGFQNFLKFPRARPGISNGFAESNGRFVRFSFGVE